MLTEKRIVNEVAPTAVISHCSHRLRRPTPSSMFAESLALAEASKHGDFFRAVLAELLVPGFEYRKWEWHAKVEQDRQFYAKQLLKENHSLTIV